jgi:hypothetical protein
MVRHSAFGLEFSQERTYRRASGWFDTPRIYLIRVRSFYSGGKLVDEVQRCEVHGSLLERRQVPVAYGLPIRNEALDEARATLFPNSLQFVLVGCIDSAIGDHVEAFVCEECREAETRWRQDNGE